MTISSLRRFCGFAGPICGIRFCVDLRIRSSASATAREPTRLQRDPPAARHRPHLSANRRAFSSSSALGIDPVAGERPAAEVVDEQVMGHGQLEPGPPRPLGQVVVVEEPQAEPLVEPADRRHKRPASSAGRTPTAWAR